RSHVALRCTRQWHWDRAAILRPYLRHFPTPAWTRRIPRHWDRPCALQKDGRATRWTHVARIEGRAGDHVLLHASRRASSMIQNGRGRPVEILLIEDNPADVRLTQEALAE